MSDPAPTRQQTVEANIAALYSTYGEDAFKRLVVGILKDISVSLAMLVDAGTTQSGT